MKNLSNPRQMIVEGYDDLYSVAALMRHHVAWSDVPFEAPVTINFGRSADEILERENLTVYLKSTVIKKLGVIFDADSKLRARYDSFYSFCNSFFPTMPRKLPKEGLIVTNDEGNSLGLWVMPDNSSKGSLETFLKLLVPDQSGKIWLPAVDSTKTARSIGCKYRDCHTDKAEVYTWLAWHDPPGQTPGDSLRSEVFNPHCDSATPFISWFKKLYNL